MSATPGRSVALTCACVSSVQPSAGKNTRSRHRLVYDAVGDLLHGKIHALIIEAKTPEDL